MELSKVLKERRSIRAYDGGRKLEKAVLEQLIEAAVQAPSWKNSQTGRYYVVSSEEMLEKVSKEALPEFNRNSSEGAAALIVATFVKSRSGFTREGAAENEVGEGWGCYDLGMQNQNLVLKAYDLGLGTLIMGIRDSDKLRELLDIPEQEEVVSVIAVGYAQNAPEAPKRKSVEEIAKFV